MLKYRILNFEVPEFAIIKPEPDVDAKYAYNVGVEIGLSPENRMMKFKFTFRFLQQEELCFLIALETELEIEADSWDTIATPEKVAIPRDAIMHIATVTIGAARGILFERLRNSPWQRFLMPPIEINDLIKSEMVFDVLPTPQP